MDLISKFKHLIISLLPPGKFWRIEAKSPIDCLFSGISEELSRVQSDIDGMQGYLVLSEEHYVAKWESLLGLEPKRFTLDERRCRVRFYLDPPDSLNQDAFAQFLIIEGYPNFEIVDHAVTNSNGLVIGDQEQDNSFTITLTTNDFMAFRADYSSAGTPLVEFKNCEFEALVNRIKPAHVRANIKYKTKETRI